MYIWSFRNEGCFHEAVTNQILDDLVKAIAPRYLRLTAVFNVRGGIYTHVTAEHQKQSWKGQLPPPAWHVDPTGAGQTPMRSEGRRVGKECVSNCRHRGLADPKKKKKK